MEPLLSSNKFQQLLGDEACQSLRCSICLDFYEQPVFLLCGHSFCYRCIRDTAMHVLSTKPHLPPWNVYVDCPNCRRPQNAFKVTNNSISANYSLSAVIRALGDTTVSLPVHASTNTHCPEKKSVSTQTDHCQLPVKNSPDRKYEYKADKLNDIQSELEHVFSQLKHGSCIIDDAMADIDAIRNNLDKCQKAEVEKTDRKEVDTSGNPFPWQIGMPISLEALMKLGVSRDSVDVPAWSSEARTGCCIDPPTLNQPVSWGHERHTVEDPAIVKSGHVDGRRYCCCTHAGHVHV